MAKLNAKQRAAAQKKAALINNVAATTGFSTSHVRKVLNGTRKNKEISSTANRLRRGN